MKIVLKYGSNHLADEVSGTFTGKSHLEDQPAVKPKLEFYYIMDVHQTLHKSGVGECKEDESKKVVTLPGIERRPFPL